MKSIFFKVGKEYEMFQRVNIKVRFFLGWNREIRAKLVNQPKNSQMAGKILWDCLEVKPIQLVSAA